MCIFSALLEDCPRHLQKGRYRSRHPRHPNHVHSALHTKLIAPSKRLGMLTEPAGFKRSPLLKEPRETERTYFLIAWHAWPMEFAFLDLLISPFESFFNESAVLTLNHDIDHVQLHKWRYRCSTTERVHKLLAPEAFRMAVAHGKEMLVHMYVLYTYTIIHIFCFRD